MSTLQVLVELENARPVYQPGDLLAFRYRTVADEPVDVRALEVSVLWFTEGKGNEDLATHFFERVEPGELERRDTSAAQRQTTRLPVSPLSYEGLIVKVRWCVRVRVRLVDGTETVGEVPFQLGNVRRAQEVA